LDIPAISGLLARGRHYPATLGRNLTAEDTPKPSELARHMGTTIPLHATRIGIRDNGFLAALAAAIAQYAPCDLGAVTLQGSALGAHNPIRCSHYAKARRRLDVP